MGFLQNLNLLIGNLGPTMKIRWRSNGNWQKIRRSFTKNQSGCFDIGKDGLVLNRQNNKSFNEEEIEEHLQTPDDDILYYVVAALHKGISIEKNLSSFSY